MTAGRAKYDLTGHRCGRLSVQEYVGRSRWRCVCDCGRETTPKTDNLKKGVTSSCGCLGRELRDASRFKGYGDMSGDFWRSILDGARQRNIPVDLTIDQAYLLLDRQDWTCPYTGRLLEFGPLSRGNSRRNLSLDRINSDLGYTAANCEWIWKPLNQMKRQLSKEAFIDWAGRVARPRLDLPADDEQILTQSLFCIIATNAKGRQHRFDVDRGYLNDIFRQQHGRCVLSAYPLSLKTVCNHQSTKTASLDRIDSSIGYVPDNVQWLHKDVNLMKRSFSDDEFRSICREIAERHTPLGV